MEDVYYKYYQNVLLIEIVNWVDGIENGNKVIDENESLIQWKIEEDEHYGRIRINRVIIHLPRIQIASFPHKNELKRLSRVIFSM